MISCWSQRRALAKLPRDQTGLAGKVADTFNEIVSANERIAQQLEEVGNVVGREGKTRKRVRFGVSTGAWADMEASVNALFDDLLWPTTAVTRGDLLQTVELEVDGRPLKGDGASAWLLNGTGEAA